MLRIVLIIVAAIFIVFVAASVIRTLTWLALIAIIVAAVALALGVVRSHRRSEHHSGRRR